MKLNIGGRLHKLEDAVLDPETNVLKCRRCPNSAELLHINNSPCFAILGAGVKPVPWQIKQVTENKPANLILIELHKTKLPAQ